MMRPRRGMFGALLTVAALGATPTVALAQTTRGATAPPVLIAPMGPPVTPATLASPGAMAPVSAAPGQPLASVAAQSVAAQQSLASQAYVTLALQSYSSLATPPAQATPGTPATRPVSQADIERSMSQYFTNGAEATAIPEAGAAAAYFQNGAGVLAEPTSVMPFSGDVPPAAESASTPASPQDVDAATTAAIASAQSPSADGGAVTAAPSPPEQLDAGGDAKVPASMGGASSGAPSSSSSPGGSGTSGTSDTFSTPSGETPSTAVAPALPFSSSNGAAEGDGVHVAARTTSNRATAIQPRERGVMEAQASNDDDGREPPSLHLSLWLPPLAAAAGLALALLAIGWRMGRPSMRTS